MRQLLRQLRTSALTTMVVVVLGAAAAQAGQAQNSIFLGIWQGIDEMDGGLVEALISPNKQNGVDLLWYETYWRVCDGGRGILKGSGNLGPKGNRVLIVQASAFCFETQTTPWEGTLTFTRENDALILVTGVQNDNTETFVDVPLYRVSEQTKKFQFFPWQR